MGTLIASMMHPILACAVCTGSLDDVQTNAANMGIWVMLVVLVGVFSCIVSFIVSIARHNSRAMAEADFNTKIKR